MLARWCRGVQSPFDQTVTSIEAEPAAAVNTQHTVNSKVNKGSNLGLTLANLHVLACVDRHVVFLLLPVFRLMPNPKTNRAKLVLFGVVFSKIVL